MFPAYAGLIFRWKLVSQVAETCSNLSVVATSAWAKTGSDDYNHLWMPLFVHMADSAMISCFIWDWLANSTKVYLCENIHLDEAATKGLISWFAGVHDVGKATPNFQMKVPERADLPRQAGLPLPDGQKAKSYSHAYMGGVAIEGYLLSRGMDKRKVQSFASVVSEHHGQNPNVRDIKDIRLEESINPRAALGGAPWEMVRTELIGWLQDEVCGFDPIVDGPDAPLDPYAQILIGGIVIMCDWLASNTDLFPLVDHVDDASEFRRRAERAWKCLNMVEHHAFDEPKADEDLFRARFASRLPAGAEMLDVQKKAIEAAPELGGGGLMLIEAPMGSGKTEASLLAAEVLGCACGSGGICYLLPTMATSDAMFSRVEDWLGSIADSSETDAKQDLHLLHSKAALNDEFRGLVRWGIGWMGDDARRDESIVCHQWFSGSKRGLLAPSSVGTVDQLLMAALSVRHVHLRHLGLCGKVIVVDEVHAYDEYMGVYLKRMLSFLGSYRVPVILLSATLPASRRDELMKAYQGRDTASARRRELSKPPRNADDTPAYPLVTTIAADSGSPPRYYPCAYDPRRFPVEVSLVEDDNEALAKRLEELLSEGGCACVLRNTVRGAQETFRVLSDHLDVEVMLCHARFVAYDRARIEKRLREMLGPSSTRRPQSLVVVSTQVIEQSLDVDFDVMVSDVAPVDILLQRMGRLHRHARGQAESERPERLRQARMFVTGVCDEGGVPSFDGGTDKVYDRALLMRTVHVLKTLPEGRVVIPDDISRLVEYVYDRGDEILAAVPESWRDALVQANGNLENRRALKRESASGWLLKKPRGRLCGWMERKLDAVGEQHGRAVVRDGLDSVEVVLLKKCGGGLGLLPWVADELGVQGDLGSGFEEVEDDVAHAAALSTVPLPYALCLPHIIDDVLDGLERAGRFSGLRESRWLDGMSFLVVDEEGRATIKANESSYVLRYTRDGGLEVI